MGRKAKHRCACGGTPRGGQRTCLSCHAAYTRAWRAKNPQTAEQRRRSNARAYLHVYVKRGKVQRQPCPCGALIVQAHHHDYSRPLDVEWLCPPCHRMRHVGP